MFPNETRPHNTLTRKDEILKGVWKQEVKNDLDEVISNLSKFILKAKDSSIELKKNRPKTGRFNYNEIS